MALLRTPSEVDASPVVRSIYNSVTDIVTFVPQPTRMLATSPAILEAWWDTQKHFMDGGRFSKELLAYIRLLVSVHCDFPFCIEFNTVSLKMILSLRDEEVNEAIQDPSRARLPESERALLLFVLHVIREPDDISAEEVQALRDLGWLDEDIFEAAYYGAWMLLVGRLFNAFKMHEV